MRSRCILLLALVFLVLSACEKRSAPVEGAGIRAEKGPWGTGDVTLILGKGPDVAEIVFLKNELVRIDYKTGDTAIREQVRTRVEGLVAAAKEKRLPAKWHEDGDTPGEERLVGASPRPGEPHFARVMYHHLGEKDGFSVRVR
jgi:hypothetical protein